LHRLVLEEEDPTALGLLRIVLVTVFTLALLAHVGSVGEYFSDESMIGGEYARAAFHSRWSLLFFVGDPTAVRVFFAIGVIAHLLWLLGLFTRPASVVAWLVWWSLIGRNANLYSYPDQLLMAFVTWMMIFPAGRGLSLDARLRGKGGPVPVWCRRIIQLQLAVLYFKSVTLKTGKTWQDGTAIYYALVSPYNRHFDVGRTLAEMQDWALAPSVNLTKAFQYGFAPFVAWHWLREVVAPRRRLPDLRIPLLLVGFGFHAIIQLFLYVVWFSALCVCAYAAFLTPSEARRLIAWLRRLTGLDAQRRTERAKRET
jgi:hypothetical protein